jgi:hypothetical protein
MTAAVGKRTSCACETGDDVGRRVTVEAGLIMPHDNEINEMIVMKMKMFGFIGLCIGYPLI